MDRSIVYPSEQPTSNVWLSSDKAKMIALGYLSRGILDVNPICDGLLCTPTTPASLAVQISDGSIYALEAVDTTSYSSLPLDTVHQIVKQGISFDITNLTLVPPPTSGQAINYLIQAAFSEQDTGAIILGYFNSDNPEVPFSGPAGSGVTQPTVRQGLISLVAKAGIAATAGSQTTPAPDPGFVGLWQVVVANGATQLTSAQISLYPGAPFIYVKLPGVPPFVQGGTWEFSLDTGTANAAVVTLNPIPTALTAGMMIFLRKVAAANTGPMIITVNTLPTPITVPIVHNDGSPLASGDAAGAYRMDLKFDGTSFVFLNAPIATAVGALTASAGEGISVTPSGQTAIVALNYPSLVDEPAVANADLFSFYSILDAHHRVETWAQLVANLHLALPISLINFQFFTATGTYIPTPLARSVFGILGGPAGGGGAQGSFRGAGGGSGETAFFRAPAVTTVVTLPVGGIGGVSGANGNPGAGPATFGAFASAFPGGGGQFGGSVIGRQNGGLGGTGGIVGNGAIGINVPGNPGMDGYGGAGNGGVSFLGGAGRAGAHNTPPLPGFFGSGGGGGGDAFNAGGNGGNAYCLLMEFS